MITFLPFWFGSSLSWSPFCSKYLLFRLGKSSHNKESKKRPGEQQTEETENFLEAAFLRGFDSSCESQSLPAVFLKSHTRRHEDDRVSFIAFIALFAFAISVTLVT